MPVKGGRMAETEAFKKGEKHTLEVGKSRLQRDVYG
jgi:hypothetical protein